MSPAGGAVIAEDVQLHELDSGRVDMLRREFHRSDAGVLLARAQRPTDEAGLRRGARAAGCGPFAKTASGYVQQYVTRGRAGTPAASMPRGSDFWHQDNSYLSEGGSRWTSLYATGDMPEAEGDTHFAHLAAAWDALDEHLQAAARHLTAWHCHAHNCGRPHPNHAKGASRPPARHLLVRKHPITGREVLFLSPCYLKEPDAAPGPAKDAAAALIRQLTEHALQPRFTFSHRWRPGDWLFWDNYLVMHRASTLDMSPHVTRAMFRTSFSD